MDIEEFREYCLSFKAAGEEHPFDENTVAFKVMDKIFALADEESFKKITIKCDPVKAVTLRRLYPEVKPGLHMNKKHWNSIDTGGRLDDELIKEWIKDSYELVVENLPRKKQKKLEAM